MSKKKDKAAVLRGLVKRGFKVPLNQITPADAFLLAEKGIAVEVDGDGHSATVRRQKRRRPAQKPTT